MKTVFNIIWITLFGVLLISCAKKTEEPSTEDLLTDHPWNLASATVDNQSVDYYNGLILNFTSMSYTTTNGGSLWATSGTWSFLDDAKTTLVREDDLELHIESITSNELILTFIWQETVFESGRTESVEGDHRMVFTD